jgi:hypothetical protein
MDLPPLLAGPIVRRVEPALVSVWVATSEPCAVRLRVWAGPVTAGGGTDGDVFEPGGAAAGGDATTLRVGAKLHVAVVTAATPGPNAQPLLPGARYSYNVSFRVQGKPAQDLRTLGLLEDKRTQPMLGYQPGVLPSFATCPATIDDLVVLHGSCNRIQAKGGPNLLYAVDELVEHDLDEPRHRPHQLWLTGDQVYADEVPGTLSSRITALGRQLLGIDEVMRVDRKQPDGSTAPLDIRLVQANFPAAYRKKLMTGVARLTSSEADSHLLGLTERLAMQLMLWSPVVWERDGNGKVLLDDPKAVVPSKQPPLTDETPADAKDWLSENLQTFEHDVEFRKALRAAKDEVELVLAYTERIGRIRRGLANVSTYMVFDDHDVTDDWNLCQLWNDQVLGNPLGRSVVRDGLVSFAVTQGWGNDPAAYETGSGADLLARTGELFRASATHGPDPQAAAAIDTLLGLAGQPPSMRWNFTVDGPVHRVIACDTRTRRSFTGPVSPPVQFSDAERDTQIPEGPLEAGLEMLMVVLSQPALDPILLGELTQGLISRGVSAMASISKKLDDPEAIALTGLEALDYEGWGARPAETARLLDRLASYKRVMILSGDVHFAVTLGLMFWRHGQGLVSVIGQFTSSALQYITFPEVLVPLLGQGWANKLLNRGYPVSLLVWRDPVDDPVSSPSLPTRGLRRRMLQRPVLLPTRGWPTGASVATPPDFAWSVQLISDQRPDVDRPEPVQPEPLPGEFDSADPLHSEHGYPALARRHQAAVRKHSNTRTVGMFNKIARLSFSRQANGGRLVARSELMSIDHHGSTTSAPEPFTVHELVYDAPPDTPEPTIEA